MGRIFGTDGARGVAGTELSCELAMKIGRAAAYVLTKHFSQRPMILIGRDTRISSKMLESALIAGICSVGSDTTSIGVVPTPAVAFLVGHYHCEAGIMISASHNPVEYNGIKIFNRDGYKLSDELEEEVERYVLDCPDEIPLKTGCDLGRSFARRSAVNDYIAHLVDTVDGDLRGIRIAVDCANGSASATAEQLFRSLGAVPMIIHAEPDGTNINDHCGSTHLEDLQKFVKNHHCMCGVAFDGDADRCLAVDENGELIDGDQMIAIFAREWRERGVLTGNTAVVTVMSNLGFFLFAQQEGIAVEKTKVGDRYVLEHMKKNHYVLGGEQSGHIIFHDFATTGDGQLSAIQLLSILQKKDCPLSVLASCMERFPQVLVNVSASAEQKRQFETNEHLSELIAREDQKLGNAGRVLVRASGTEPIIRVMIEGQKLDEITYLANAIADEIQRVIGAVETI